MAPEARIRSISRRRARCAGPSCQLAHAVQFVERVLQYVERGLVASRDALYSIGWARKDSSSWLRSPMARMPAMRARP